MTGERRNRLANERSPYLLGHTGDPVDWYPWGQEAFEKARRENKPILLSIGYSACHWCHVMHRESFEDRETASLLNDAFVCVKVDREERPDIDRLYMEVSIAMTGSGGWPLTILLTPERRPFFAATYLPRESRCGMIGLRDLARGVKRLWSERREELLASGDEVLRSMGVLQQRGGTPGEEDIHSTAYLRLRSGFDPEWGGFGGAMKFPLPQHLMYLLLHHHLTKKEESLAMVERTLERMWQGGIHDHVGFGFHRYTTDRAWRSPHFEKMLYDQAFMIAVYAQTYLLTGVEGYARIARWTAGYLLRELTTNGGGFAASQSAETEGLEGAYYLWREEELRAALYDELFSLFQMYFRLWKAEHISAGGGEEGGGVLHLDTTLTDIRGKDGRLTPASEELERIRSSLEAVRATRAKPERDTKVLTDWNGYAVAALAIAGRALGERDLLEAAERAMRYLLEEHSTDNEDLVHVGYRRGAEGNSFASDWAAVIWGLIELHQSTLDQDYLLEAIRLNHRFIERFWDGEDRILRFIPKGEGDLPFAGRDIQDGPIPSSSAIALQNLVRLYWLTGDLALKGYAREMAEVALREAAVSPLSCTGLLYGKMLLDMPPIQVSVCGSAEDPEVLAAIRLIRRHFAPNLVIHSIQRGAHLEELMEVAPALEWMGLESEGKGIHLCTGFTCRRPISDLKELERELARVLHVGG